MFGPLPDNTLRITSFEGELLAWTDRYEVTQYKERIMFAIPVLNLSYESAMYLMAGRPYHHVFSKGEVEYGGEMYRPLVLHASFDMWATSESDLKNVAFVLVQEGDSIDGAHLGGMISKAADTLRELEE